MPNQYINKVVYGGSPLIDLTSDTVTAADVAQGVWFHLPSGERVQGAASVGGGDVWQDAQGYVHLDEEGGGSSVDVEPLSVTENGTYTAPTGTAYSPVTVNVSGGMPSGFAVGTLTVASDVATTSSVKITDTTEMGFTPTKFYFYATSNPESAGAIYAASYEGFASYNARMRAYFSNNALSASAGVTSWTSLTSGHLYFSSNTVYINASSTYVLKAGTYGWVAIQ